jgi:hypothetical protein
MLQHICVLNTDSLNRYGQIMPANVLESALRQRWSTGTPCNLSHDQTKPIGWMTPISLYFEPQVTKLIGVFQVAETEDESTRVIEARNAYLYQSHKERCSEYKALLEARLEDVLGDGARLLDAGCSAFRSEGIAVRKFSAIFDSEDDDGLIDVTDFKYLGGGVFDIDGLAVFAHRYYRQSFSHLNYPNFQFLDSLMKLRVSGVRVLLALDHDLVGWSDSYLPYIELEYWWGPKFNDDLSSIETGITTHEANDFGRLYEGVSRTEFWWQSRKGEHIFESEELRDIPSEISSDSFGCRYVHCVVDESTGKVRHLDGAIRSYSDEEMIARIDINISQSDRSTEYTKLWRIDEDISIEEWKSLVSDYYRGNRLVGEYLGGEDEEQGTFPCTKADISQSFDTLQEFVPYGIDADSGIRVNLSYHELVDNKSDTKFIFPLDTITIDDNTMSCVDFWVVEVRKILRKLGGDVFIPKDIALVVYEDLYTNLPLIVHPTNDEKQIEETFAAINELLLWSKERNHNRAISINVSYPLEDRELRLSIYGHSKDLLDFLETEVPHLPFSNADIDAWMLRMKTFMNKWSESTRPIIHDVMKPSGILWINRQQIPEDINVELNYFEDEKRLKYAMELPQHYEALKKSLEDGTIAIRCASIVDEVICTGCSRSFLECDCSAVLDDVTKKITKLSSTTPFFTDKPA